MDLLWLLLLLSVWVALAYQQSTHPSKEGVTRWLRQDYRSVRRQSLENALPPISSMVIPPQPSLVRALVWPTYNRCGLALTELHLPPNAQILGVVRDGQVLLALDSLTLAPGDWILATTLDPSQGQNLKRCLEGEPHIQTAPVQEWAV